jgi:undecaprenyl diphosphate synthase
MHVAIIMDGNVRWAANRGRPRSFGHKKGASRVTEIVECCPDLGVKSLTIYAFSTENWNRAAHEVESLMRLFRGYLQNKFLSLVENNVKVKFIGDPTPIARDLRLQMRNLERATKNNAGLNLNVALNYGGRDEIVRACRKIAKKIGTNDLNVKDIDENLFEAHLDTAGLQGPDIIIRTAGEQRISNFLLWQAAYSEFYYTDLNWPEFTVGDLRSAINELSSRNRTFGKLKIKQ